MILLRNGVSEGYVIVAHAKLHGKGAAVTVDKSHRRLVGRIVNCGSLCSIELVALLDATFEMNLNVFVAAPKGTDVGVHP